VTTNVCVESTARDAFMRDWQVVLLEDCAAALTTKTEHDAAVIDGLGAAGTATVHEAIGRVGYAGSDLRPIQQDVRIAGSAVTVLSHPGDNIMIHAAVEVCQAGDVLVVVNTAPSRINRCGPALVD